MSWHVAETRLGAFVVEARDGRVRRINLPGTLPDGHHALASDGLAHDGDLGVLQACATQLREYAAGQRVTFDVPLAAEGTPFQQRVWAALQDIPFGQRRTYADIAVAIGKPGAARAVGQANRHNPLPVVVPCHRVLAADGRLGGYMGQWGEGDGIVFKQRLLDHEGLSPPDNDARRATIK